MILHARPRDLGGFSVRRVLPSKERRLVGPFVFWDHMGPAHFEAGTGIDVRPHPHINLATVTYLFDGEIDHRDSLGSHQVIRPGAVNWMTAGRGIVHSERTPPDARRAGSTLHGIQSWIALPRADEETDPSFWHHPESTIPALTHRGARLRIIAGAAYGATSPVRTFSPMFYVDAELDAGAELELPGDYEERAAYVASGTVSRGRGGETLDVGSMLVDLGGTPATLHAERPSRVLLLGGAPLDGERHVWWNFVSSSTARIEAAKAAWRRGDFPKVPGDEAEFIPLPD